MAEGDETGGIWITSGRNPDGPPDCMITWDGHDWIAPATDVRTTALDLVTCAAYAEMMMELIVKAGLPPATVTAFATSLLSGSGRTMFGTPSTLTLMPAGSSKKKQALVLVERGPKQCALTPDEAREMALGWLTTAETAESDQLVAEALRANGADEAMTEKVFRYLRELRAGVTGGQS